jgi:hypothetical protein
MKDRVEENKQASMAGSLILVRSFVLLLLQSYSKLACFSVFCRFAALFGAAPTKIDCTFADIVRIPPFRS